MINDLDREVVASEVSMPEYGLLPKGKYALKLVEVSDWVPKTLTTLKAIKFDDKFQKVKDADGKDIITIMPNYVIHEVNLKFEIIGGDYSGRWVFHKISTHPNIPWDIPNFLNAIGVSSLKLRSFPTLVGMTLTGSVDIDSYEKKVVDKDTGIETYVPKEFNVIKRFIKNDVDMLDMI